MTKLKDFFQVVSPDKELLLLADSLPFLIKKIQVDQSKAKLALHLGLDENFPEVVRLLELTDMLKQKWNLKTVELYFPSDFWQGIGKPTFPWSNVWQWCLSCLKQKHVLFSSLLNGANFCCQEDQVQGSLAHRFDSELESSFKQEVESFFLSFFHWKVDFVWQEQMIEQHQQSWQALASKHQKELLEHAQQAMKISEVYLANQANLSESQGVQPEVKKASKRNQGAKLETALKNVESTNSEVKEVVNQDSWVYKAQVLSSEQPKAKFVPQAKTPGTLWGKVNLNLPLVKIGDFSPDTGLVLFAGQVEFDQANLTKSGSKVRVNFYVTDDTSSIACVYFMKPSEADAFESTFKKGGYAQFQGNVYFDDRYSRDLQATVEGVMEREAPASRKDMALVKRVELHCHSKMSEKDAVIDVERIFQEAVGLGHRACALTDHGVVQGFPEMAETIKKINRSLGDEKFKGIFGLEGYVVDDGPCIVYHLTPENSLDKGFVAIDIETTGLDALEDRIIEIAAVKFIWQEGKLVVGESFQTLVNPERALTDFIIKLTGITDLDLQGAPSAIEAVKLLKEFVGEIPLCGHNILFDLGFLRYVGFQVDVEQHLDYRVKFNQSVIDTVPLAKVFYPELKTRKLGDVAKHLFIPQKEAHRALDDALVCGEILAYTLNRENITQLHLINERAGTVEAKKLNSKETRSNHIVLLAQNALGLYHLYRMVSLSHLDYYYRRPRIPRSLLQYFKTGIIVGSACERGEIFEAVLQAYIKNNLHLSLTIESLKKDYLLRTKSYLYDYFEIQPLSNNQFMVRDSKFGLKDQEDLKNLNKIIVALGQEWKKLVCATTDAHFFESKEGEFRQYMLMDMGFKDAEFQADLYYRTTQEMLEEFAYLGEAKANEVVVTNTNLIADRIEYGLKPFPEGTFPPIIASAPKDIEDLTWGKAKELYGYQGEVSVLVKERVEKELKSIIGNGFAIMYYIAYKLVKKSNDDGYLVGSRGSVGSSLVAFLCGISEVNPMPPHYLCPHCHYSEFDLSGAYGSGFDLPPKTCSQCQNNLIAEGQDIPFETFLGFYGDKQPDIDLNFSGEYQGKAHKYVEELFGQKHTFRAGTIGCFADKNAIMVVNKIIEKQGISLSKAEIRRRSRGLIGVKRTTGQHPGGIVVVPKEMDVYEFTPIQKPANKVDSEIITTHFDFNAMHDTILKLDILGHADPTMLKMLGDLTGIDVRNILVTDEKVMSLFTSTEVLGIPEGTSPAQSATLGLSEMGTFMARDMIRETRPKRFYDLVQLMGLSHGTDVWKGNAQDLIRSGICDLNSVIGCRDSIMTQLIYWGLPNKESFNIMEKVRKGKGLASEDEALMREKNVPDWYIDSCKKIKYMFPKAHAVAYAISSLRIAWFKIYYPEEYYCAFFSIRGDDFDGGVLCQGIEEVQNNRKRLYEGFVQRKPNEKSLYYLCELVEEMYLRGIEFVPYSLEHSTGDKFVKQAKGKILPPLNAIPNISTAMAKNICQARAEGDFKNREDLAKRSGLGPVAIESLANSGCIADLPESAQMDLFSLMGM